MPKSVREHAVDILNEVSGKLPIGSNEKQAEFTAYTGYTQKMLTTLWESGSGLTCCNEFVSWYSKELAKRLEKPVLPLGNFSTEGWLAANRKHHAWVRPTEGARPFPGDIYRPRSFHMGIVYSCDDPGKLVTIDAGQGGPKSGQDFIKKLDRQYVVGNFLGWVDIEKLFTDAPVHPMPPWLSGWWEVTIQQRRSWYYFGADYTVTRTNSKPIDTGHPPFQGETISFSIEFATIFVLSWPKKTKFGTHYEVEKFGPRPFAGNGFMDGERDGLNNMTATKL